MLNKFYLTYKNTDSRTFISGLWRGEFILSYMKSRLQFSNNSEWAGPGILVEFH